MHSGPSLEEQARQEQARRDNTFNVGTGGYGRQLSRFRKQFGADNADLFKGDDAVDYRQFAKAMGNRGLQVGDTFDARSVLNNLRAMRGNEGPGANPTFNQVGVQRGGRDIGNFQNLSQQRAAGQRRQQDYTQNLSGGGHSPAYMNPTRGLNLPQAYNVKTPSRPVGQGYVPPQKYNPLASMTPGNQQPRPFNQYPN